MRPLPTRRSRLAASSQVCQSSCTLASAIARLSAYWPRAHRTLSPQESRSWSKPECTVPLVATLLGLALLTLVSACGMNAQTLQPYTPAEGVNFNVGPPGESVQVRNLMILSREDGVGYVSASMVAEERDALTAVAGHPFKARRDPRAPPSRPRCPTRWGWRRGCWWC